MSEGVQPISAKVPCHPERTLWCHGHGRGRHRKLEQRTNNQSEGHYDTLVASVVNPNVNTLTVIVPLQEVSSTIVLNQSHF